MKAHKKDTTKRERERETGIEREGVKERKQQGNNMNLAARQQQQQQHQRVLKATMANMARCSKLLSFLFALLLHSSPPV